MKFFVGTSGWSYDWNPNGIKWYVENSKLNSVELNSSFYRFPFKVWINAWKKHDLIWIIKVNRIITHLHRLNEKSYPVWKKFRNLFLPMESKIKYYLFQMPPNFKELDRVLEFVKRFGKEKFAFEFRNKEMYSEKVLKKLRGVTVVSVDEPGMTKIVKTSKDVYLRLHGKTFWYSHNYSEREIKELIEEVIKLNPRNLYVMFNNDHNMLENARKCYEILNHKVFNV